VFNNPWFYAAIVGTLIIIALALYAAKLLKQVKQQTQQQLAAQAEQQLALNKHDSKILDSVVLIVRAMKEEQCDISEGCWRLCVLLESLKTTNELNLQFPAIFELYDSIKHLSILEERKKLDKKQRMKQDVERMKVEAKLQPKIKDDVELLHQYAIERISALKPH